MCFLKLLLVIEITIHCLGVVDYNDLTHQIEQIFKQHSNKLGGLFSGTSIWSRNRKESKTEVSKWIMEFKSSCSGALMDAC